MTPSQIGGVSLPRDSATAPKSGAKAAEGFKNALNVALGDQSVKLSAHAQKRLQESNVSLSEQDKARLGQAVNQMGEKGAQRSLVLMDISRTCGERQEQDRNNRGRWRPG